MSNDSGEARFFPLFVNLQGRAVLVIGAGRVAMRRIHTLLPFGCRIRVIAPEAPAELLALAREGSLIYEKRAYRDGDCADAFLALAATNSRETNRAVAVDCARRGIPVNVSDSPAACDFYFPGIAREGPVVAGVTASGTNHRLARRVTERLRENLGAWAAQEHNPADEPPGQINKNGNGA